MNELEQDARRYLHDTDYTVQQVFLILFWRYPSVPAHSIQQIIQQNLPKPSNPNDISGKNIQSVTLKFTDGTEVTVPR